MISSARDDFEAPDRSFIGHRDILTRSLARYKFVAPLLRGVTLEIGCGRGYGFEVIQDSRIAPVGLDISLRFLADVRKRFSAIPLVNGSGTLLPFADHSFDAIISFEVIEHADDDVTFLTEIRRVARPDAPIAISTPNRLVASGDAERPLDLFHVREYTSGQFQELLGRVFSSVSMFSQHEPAQDAGLVGRGTNRLVNRVPVRWKYLVPDYVQGLLSVLLRPPLRLHDCRFETGALESAHTFVALCHL